MTKPKSRAIRRHHRNRYIAKAAKMFPRSRHPQRYADNRTPCSCWGCGHARYWFGRTIQERRELQSAD